MHYTLKDDNGNMGRKQPITTLQLGKPQVAELKRLLASHSIDSYHRVGSELNTLLKDSKTRGTKVIVALAAQLECSPNMLHKVRMLAALWKVDDVKAAMAMKLPWHAVIQLMFLDGLARRVPEERRGPVIKQRQDLVGTYPLDLSGLKAWREALAAARLLFLPNLTPGSKARQVVEVRQAVVYRLQGALDRMKAGEALLPPAAVTKANRLYTKLGILRDEIEALYVGVTKELKGMDN